MEAHLKSEDTEIPTEIVREILLKLPTTDLARSCCVCKLWRNLIRDDSFRKLHDANHASATSQVLLVSENREPGKYEEARVYAVSSAKALCCTTIPTGYSLTNICNGFLCFALHRCVAAPVMCNPVTGEKRALPIAPPLVEADGTSLLHLFYVLGFSPSTQEYKLFRFAYAYCYVGESYDIHMDVHTLGSGGGWRQHTYPSPCHPIHSLPPVLIDGRLYMVISGWKSKRYSVPDRMLVVDVATETHRSYRIPEDCHQGYELPLLNGFELNGRMCVAINVLRPRRKLHFWVMASPDTLRSKEEDYRLNWELRYNFYVDAPYVFNRRKGAWLDDSENLCFRHDVTLYKFHTRRHMPPLRHDGCLEWDKQLQLSEAPSQWNIYGGYHPSLLSPFSFSLLPTDDDGLNGQHFEPALLRQVNEMTI